MLFNSEYKNIIKQIDATFLELEKECSACVWDELKQTTMGIFKKSGKNKMISFFREYQYTPRIWTIFCCSNISGDIVESGREHVYRGLLGLRGREFYNVFLYTTQKLVKEGAVPKDQAERNIDALIENINSVG